VGVGVTEGGFQDASEEGADWEVLQFSGGLREYVTFLNRDKTEMHPPVYVKKSVDGVEVEMALQW
jgi:DNA gyrase/topoisomerase IV subunit B